MNPISQDLGKHYEKTFEKHGPTAEGVDWGNREDRAILRYEKMLEVMREPVASGSSILDVGCGYGGLYEFCRKKRTDLKYTGIDVAGNMIEWAKGTYPDARFLKGDILDTAFAEKFDYVICNGILTQKLDASNIDMDVFAKQIIRKMYEICNRGIVFNVCTTKVNYFSNNLFYKSPVEMLAFCMDEVSPKVVIDHAYPLYEYSTFVFR